MRDVYFDYDLQVWVRHGKIQRCGHPESMSTPSQSCCEARRLQGLTVCEARELNAADADRARAPANA